MRKSKRKSMISMIKKNWVLYLFLLPAIASYIIFYYRPIYGIQIAFQDYRIGETFGQSEWVGFKHFTRFFNSVWFETVLKNTFTISLMGFIGFPLPIILALMLNELKNMKFRKLVQTVSYAPHFISTVVLCGTVQLFLSPSTGLLGVLINNVREIMGLGPINLLTQGSAFKWIYTLSGIWQSTGWGTVLYFAVLSGADPQLAEAARVDGASKLQCIIHVNFPVLIPTIVIQLILAVGRILSVGYEKVYLLQNDTVLRESEVISTYVYRSGLQGAQYSFSTAVSLFNSLVNATLLILVNTIVRKINSENSLWYESPAESVAICKMYGDRLKHIHINDNYRLWDDDMIIGTVHTLEFVEFIYWLRRTGYNGYMTLDQFPYREDGRDAIAESAEWLNYLETIIDQADIEEIHTVIAKNDAIEASRLMRKLLSGV